MRNSVLITGSGGYLGHEIIKQMIKQNKWSIVALTSNPEKLSNEFKNADNLICVANSELNTDTIPWDEVYSVIHLAFARRFQPNKEIAESLLFSKRIFEQAKVAEIPSFINISSQSVYGNAEEWRTENTDISPEMIYSMAKYANEVILDTVLGGLSNTKVTHIRLDPIAQNQNLLPSLVRQAFENNKLKIVGGKQIFSLLDITDAATALLALLDIPLEQWKNIYNVGWDRKIYTLTEIATLVAYISEKHGAGKVEIELKEEDIRTYAGLNTSLFMKDTGWFPRVSLEGIIETTLLEYLNKGM